MCLPAYLEDVWTLCKPKEKWNGISILFDIFHLLACLLVIIRYRNCMVDIWCQIWTHKCSSRIGKNLTIILRSLLELFSRWNPGWSIIFHSNSAWISLGEFSISLWLSTNSAGVESFQVKSAAHRANIWVHAEVFVSAKTIFLLHKSVIALQTFQSSISWKHYMFLSYFSYL